MYDLLIRNGSVIDGTGTPARRADVAVKDGLIVEVGPDLGGDATTTIDAEGKLVTPGFVDIPTHYDGQATWDDTLDPSAGHGVTTLVMGNCGVGFAPVRPGAQDDLIQLMEGVEDIPGIALTEGMTWGWESFAEYLDVLDGRSYALDIATQVPHGAVRTYVMGERGSRNEAATAEDIAAMRVIVAEALEAGALGFSTSRTLGHRAVDGEPVPGTYAGEDELFGIGQALADVGRGVFELAPAIFPDDAHNRVSEVEWMGRLSADIGRPVTYTAIQTDDDPDLWRTLMEKAEGAQAIGGAVYPQVASRPFGMLIGLQTHHPFALRPSFKEVADLPLDELVAHLREPAVKEAILGETDLPADPDSLWDGMAAFLQMSMPKLYEIGNPPDYEPMPDRSVEAQATAEGIEPMAKFYDLMLEDDGKALLLFPTFNYSRGSQDDLREMMTHPSAILGLGDGGAHCGMICDASIQTYTLTHWARDRIRGEQLPVEWLIHKQTQQTAELYGFEDRGTLEPGKRADLNVIDHENLTLRTPHLAHDLPAGGRRLLQTADGYEATIVAGVVTRRHGEDTGARPGRLVRG
jgi:N-acyl-D-amino-acid deacylase